METNTSNQNTSNQCEMCEAVEAGEMYGYGPTGHDPLPATTTRFADPDNTGCPDNARDIDVCDQCADFIDEIAAEFIDG